MAIVTPQATVLMNLHGPKAITPLATKKNNVVFYNSSSFNEYKKAQSDLP